MHASTLSPVEALSAFIAAFEDPAGWSIAGWVDLETKTILRVQHHLGPVMHLYQDLNPWQVCQTPLSDGTPCWIFTLPLDVPLTIHSVYWLCFYANTLGRHRFERLLDDLICVLASLGLPTVVVSVHQHQITLEGEPLPKDAVGAAIHRLLTDYFQQSPWIFPDPTVRGLCLPKRDTLTISFGARSGHAILQDRQRFEAWALTQAQSNRST